MGISRHTSAQLPQGNVGTWGGISENFEFHSSPESFITGRIHQWQREHPEAVQRRAVVRAKILNRNVAIVSSYKHVRAILQPDGFEDDSNQTCAAHPAYKDLMAQFFPPPNLLLADGCPHAKMREEWDEKMRQSQSRLQEVAQVIMVDFLNEITFNVELDLYERMKALAWRLLLGCFLDLQPENTLFAKLQHLQEDLLRGQFSLFPASISMGFWRSSRKRGIDARKALQSLIRNRLTDPECRQNNFPFQLESEHEVSQAADHVLMMTSSLAVKALSSLLTAYLLNLFLYQTEGAPLYHAAAQSQASDDRHIFLRSVYMETERLSPPIAGIMRRLTQDILLENGAGDVETLLPQGWDAWIYLIGAARDSNVFGEDSERFDPYRYLEGRVPEPLGFGLGAKTCLGQKLMRNLNLTLVEQLLTKQIAIRGEVSKPGVRAWLGWQLENPEVWANDMKQLPTQHPRDPIPVTFVEYQHS